MTFEERMERLAERVEIHNAKLMRLESQLKVLMAAQRQKTNCGQRQMLDGLLLAADRLVRATGRLDAKLGY